MHFYFFYYIINFVTDKATAEDTDSCMLKLAGGAVSQFVLPIIIKNGSVCLKSAVLPDF